MLYWAFIFFITTIITGVLGFTNLAGAAAGIAEVLFFIFLGLFIVLLLLARRPPPV